MRLCFEVFPTCLRRNRSACDELLIRGNEPGFPSRTIKVLQKNRTVACDSWIVSIPWICTILLLVDVEENPRTGRKIHRGGERGGWLGQQHGKRGHGTAGMSGNAFI